MLLIAAGVILGGCAGQEETLIEETIEEAASPEETKPTDGPVLNCQIVKAEADGVDIANDLLTGDPLTELLAQRGYTCTRAEAQAVIEREKEEARAEREAARKKLEAQGVGEGSAPDPARDQCLQESYQGLSIPQKGEESRRIDAEAKEQGVSIYDVVGC